MGRPQRGSWAGIGTRCPVRGHDDREARPDAWLWLPGVAPKSCPPHVLLLLDEALEAMGERRCRQGLSSAGNVSEEERMEHDCLRGRERGFGTYVSNVFLLLRVRVGEYGKAFRFARSTNECPRSADCTWR